MTPWPRDYRMDVVLTVVKTTFILYISIRALGWSGSLSMSSNISKRPFFWAINLNSGLKYLVDHIVKQMCCHPGFEVPFIEHRQSRLSIVLKGPKIFRLANKHWLQLKVTRCITPHKKVSLSFEALKPDIDFSSPAINTKVLNGIFQDKAALSTLKIFSI